MSLLTAHCSLPTDSGITALRLNDTTHSPFSIPVTPMNSRLLPLLAGAALWLVLPSPASAQPLPVKTDEFNSESVGRKMKYNFVLPAKYVQGTDRYPVLYLLHGLTSNYTAWARM